MGDEILASSFLTSFIVAVVVIISIILVAIYFLIKQKVISFTARSNNEPEACVSMADITSLEKKAAGLGLSVFQVARCCKYAAVEDQMTVLNPEATHIHTTLRQTSMKGKPSTGENAWREDCKCLQRLASLYNKNIEIVHSDGPASTVIRPVYSRPQESRQTLYVGYDSRGRYYSLRPAIALADCQFQNQCAAKDILPVYTQENIVIGDFSHQFVRQMPSGDDDQEEFTQVRNIIIGDGSSQNVLVTFRTAKALVDFIQTTREGNQNFSDPELRMKIKVKSDSMSEEEVEERLTKLIELLNDDSSETRRDLDPALNDIGVSFQKALHGCILVELLPLSKQAFIQFVECYKNGEMEKVLVLLLSGKFCNVSNLEVCIQLQVSMKVVKDAGVESANGNKLAVVDDNKETVEEKTGMTENHLGPDASKSSGPDASKSFSKSKGISVLLKATHMNSQACDISVVPKQVVKSTFNNSEARALFQGISEMDVRLEPMCSRSNQQNLPGNLKLSSDEVVTKIQKTVQGRVGIITCGKTGTTGTCFRVGTKFVMTAYHVIKAVTETRKVDNITSFKVQFPDTEERFSSKPDYWDAGLDVAVLKLDNSNINDYQREVSNLSVADCEPGLPFYLVGYKGITMETPEQQCERAVVEIPRLQLTPSALNFQSSQFSNGCSGSPGLIVMGDKVCYVSMFQGALYSGKGVTSYGVKLSHIFEKLRKDRPDIAECIQSNGKRSTNSFGSKSDTEVYVVFMVFVVLSTKYRNLAKQCLGKKPKICRKKCRRIIPSLLRVYSEMAVINKELLHADVRDV